MGKSAPALSNFNAGELSPDFAGRVDNEKYAVGCDTLQGFIPRVQGPARRRPGTRYVQPVKNSANRTWLRRFVFSQGQAYQIEFGPNYCRFYTNHGQVQVSGVAAWSSSPIYAVGDLVAVSGVNYYCIVSHQNHTPPNATYWYPLTGTIYEIPTPYTSGMLTNSDGSCGLQIEQSGDVLYIACGSYFPMELTRLGATDWTLIPHWPLDGPFMDQNITAMPALYIAPIAGSNTTVTCFSIGGNASIFDPSDVETSTSPGRLVRIDTQYFNVAPWQTNHAYSLNDLVRYNGNTYKALNAATSAASPPTHISGVASDGAVTWLFQDSGYGIGRVTGYTSPTQVTLTLSTYSNDRQQYYNFPASTVGISKAISGATNVNPCVVTSNAHGFNVGDSVYIYGIAGLIGATEQLNDHMYVITAVTANTFTLGTVDASAYSPYVSGGTVVKNASLRWQLGAWGYGRSGFTAQLPVSVSFFADRLFWGAGITWWGSTPGDYKSHAQDIHSVVSDACAIDGVIAAQSVDSITWMNQANILLIGTKGGEFGLSPITSTQPLGPDNTQVQRQSTLRSRQIKGELVGTSNFYVQASGKKLMAQDYNFYIDRYDSTNQNRLANHIAGYSVGSGIIDIAYHAEPYECLWCVRADGVLLGYTFDRADNVTGWHDHPAGPSAAGAAVIECVSVIPAPDGTRDELWVIVKRTIGGAVVRSIEYMEKDYETGDAQSSICYVDMSAQYSGVPTTTVTGLSYLNGETVSVVIDGGGHRDVVVASGQITLDIPASVVQVGLAFPNALVTMNPEGGADVGTAQGKKQRTVIVTVRQKNTLAGYIGPANGSSDLVNLNDTTTPLGQAPPLKNGDVRVSYPGDPDLDNRIKVTQPQPFPMEIIAIFPLITVTDPSPP